MTYTLTVFWLFLALVAPCAQAQDTHHPLPNAASSTFPATLQQFLLRENASRTADAFGQNGWVVSGCLASTSGTTVLAPFACTAYSNTGHYLTQASAGIDLGASPGPACAYTDTAWVIATTDTTTPPGGNFARVSGTRYAVDCTSASQPVPPIDGLLLFAAQIAGGAVTQISPLHYRAAEDARQRLHAVRSWGAVGDGITDDRVALANADTAATAVGSGILLTPGTHLITTNLTLARPLYAMPGATIKPANGVTLTLNGRIIAGAHQILDLSAGGILRYNNQPYFNVLWTGADLAGTVDSTAAWNAATQYDRPWEDDINAFYTEILVPGGIYKLAGTVYVRAGQHLRGSGWGSTRINGTATPTNHMIQLGIGKINGVETGDGIGTFPEVSGFIVRGFGGGTNWAAIHNGYPGARISNLTLSATSIGILAENNALIINNIQIDSSFLNGIVFQNINQATVSDIYSFVGNFPIRFGSNVNDVVINNLNTAYAAFAHVSIDDGATNITNVRINNWTATMNEQFDTFLGFLHSRAAGADLHIANFAFRNMKGNAVNVAAGFGTRLTLSDGIFDGTRTNAAYSQSITSAGINAGNADITLNAVEFRNLAGQPLTVGGSGLTTITWNGGRIVNGAVTPHILITNTNPASAIYLSNIVGDGKNLYNAQPVFPVHHMGLLRR